MTQRTALVTGTSGGIGAATAARLRAAGWRVLGTSRRADGSDPDTLRLDVTDDASVEAAVAAVLDRAGRIDAVVDNAGIDLAGAVEETTAAEALRLFETDFFGVHRVTRAALPHLRAQGSGRIVVIGSLAGTVPIPFAAFYTAAKHALEGYVDALAFEVAPFGVRCTLVKPGYIRTDLRASVTRVAHPIAAYDVARTRAGEASDRGVAGGIPPERVGDAVAKVLAAANPPRRVVVGADARSLIALRRLLPPRWFEAGMRRRF